MVVSFFAFSACNKEANLIDTPESEEYLYAFAINNADNDASVETKASLASDEKGLYLKWEDGDSFGAYATGSTGNSNNRQSRVSVNGEDFTLFVASTVKLENGAQIYTYFPYYNGESKEKTRADIHIESVQTQKNTGFDASVMPMVGEPFTTDASFSQNSETEVGKIRFANLGAIIEFNIYSATPIDEQIKSVEFRAENTTPAGNFKLDLTSVVFSEEESLKLDGGTENTVKTILETPVAIPSSKDSGVKVHMVVAPGEYQGAVVVTTDAHTYTFELASPKQFNRSRVKPLNADLSKAIVGDLPHEETWELVTKVEDFTDGTYVIVSYDKSHYLRNSITPTSQNPLSGSAVFINGKLAEVKDDARWIATTSGDGLQFESSANSGNYLCAKDASTAQGIRVGVFPTYSSIWTFVENKTFGCIATAHPDNNPRYLAFFSTSEDWRYYAEGNNLEVAANFYKLEDNRVVLSAPVLNVDGSRISWEAVENAGSYLVTIDKDQQKIKKTEIDLKDLAAGYYTVSVVAVPDNTTLYKPSPAATAEEIKVGIPALEMPVLQKGSTTANSITVYWESIKGADGYAAKIVDADGKECGSQNVETLSVTFDDLTANTEYTIYVSATDTSNKFAASEQAEIKVTTAEEGYVETILNATFFASDFNSTKKDVTKGPITATFAQGNGTVAPVFSSDYVRLYQQSTTPYKGGTLTIKSTDNNIKKIEIVFNDNKNIYLASEDGIYSGGVWASPTTVESVDFYCNGTNSNQRADIVSVTVYYVSTEGGSGDSGNSGEGGGTTEPENPDQPEDSVVYTLNTTTITGKNNDYTKDGDITVGDITWNLEGNATVNPWRIGGKSITAVDRALYSKTAMPENISLIEIEHGDINKITVNSAKLIVAKDANFSVVVSTVELDCKANTTATAMRPDGANWSDCYYKFVYNLTNNTSTNYYLQFNKATFKVQ